MLDFYQIRDDQSAIPSPQLNFIGGIEYDEFEDAQAANVIENYLDYYGSFRWSNNQIQRKIAQLEKVKRASLANLLDILRQANAAECGLMAYGD